MKKGHQEQRKRDIASIRGGKPSGKKLFELKDDRIKGQKRIKKERDRRLSGSGKGDTPRSNASEAWHENYALINWGKKGKKSKSGKFVKKYK